MGVCDRRLPEQLAGLVIGSEGLQRGQADGIRPAAEQELPPVEPRQHLPPDLHAAGAEAVRDLAVQDAVYFPEKGDRGGFVPEEEQKAEAEEDCRRQRPDPDAGLHAGEYEGRDQQPQKETDHPAEDVDQQKLRQTEGSERRREDPPPAPLRQGDPQAERNDGAENDGDQVGVAGGRRKVIGCAQTVKGAVGIAVRIQAEGIAAQKLNGDDQAVDPRRTEEDVFQRLVRLRQAGDREKDQQIAGLAEHIAVIFPAVPGVLVGREGGGEQGEAQVAEGCDLRRIQPPAARRGPAPALARAYSRDKADQDDRSEDRGEDVEYPGLQLGDPAEALRADEQHEAGKKEQQPELNRLREPAPLPSVPVIPFSFRHSIHRRSTSFLPS